MSAQDYYGQPASHLHNQPYYNYGQEQELRPGTAYSSRPPTYTSQPYAPGVSPFEAPFDDHVYPARPPARPEDSQLSLGSTTYAQGGGGRPQDSTSDFRDDIPLRNTKSKHGNLSTDHVYDVAESGLPPGRDDAPKPRRAFGFFKSSGRIPWVVYGLTIIQVAVFIAELVKSAQLTGSPIATKPSFNPMIGPSQYILINMGARYVACMHNVEGVQDSSITINWQCPNSTSNSATDPSNQCTLSELCGFNGVPNPVAGGSIHDKPEPNQWYRFILPMFLHAGIIHIGFNMLLQLSMGREIEKAIGPIRFFLVYMCSGIFGFVLGGNFAGTGIASTGASGALFGIIALTLLDLLYSWKKRSSPWVELLFIALDVVISFVLGLLPGLDNFSHVGGFLMGLAMGICILHSPDSFRERINADEPPYAPVGQRNSSGGKDRYVGMAGFVKAPLGFFKGRKGAWWAWWLIRAAALICVFIVFIILLNNFYIYRHTCGWCQHLCIVSINPLFLNSPPHPKNVRMADEELTLHAQNINNWCKNINLQVQNTTTKRDVFDSWEGLAKLYEGVQA
ncbi:MAG: hypothetical protein M1818_001008 [Claussenomyces sp. TS43310]|nr:MAG: hypothetical protein M1818_001008 [Claussenomyces sp. TS43310]